MMAILYLLYDCYNGIILFVFADIIYNARDNKYWLWFLGISFGMLLLSNYSLISTIMKMPSLDVYIRFMPRATGVSISFFRSFIDSLNMVLFILFLITYLITSLNEQSHIKEELDMVSQVNTELNSYVALTEKIAEDRERKRIAREIHDTLGHALTGIAAGVDACIVLIDSDVEIVSLDRLNEFADFNYWIAVSNFKYVTIDTLKKLYGDKKEDWINFRFKYVKPLRFTGCGFSIDAFEVYHHNIVETEKTIDRIEKSILNLYPLGENASQINNDKASWYNFDLFNPIVQKRMQEILEMINLK
jgi:hypothetical protein